MKQHSIKLSDKEHRKFLRQVQRGSQIKEIGRKIAKESDVPDIFIYPSVRRFIREIKVELIDEGTYENLCDEDKWLFENLDESIWNLQIELENENL